MENGPPTIGFEDGTIDVERFLVEPKDGHRDASVIDSVLRFNEKIPHNAMDLDHHSLSFGITNTGFARENEDILNRDVLDSVSNEVEVGYYRLQNDFCSLGEEYLLGYSDIGFSENLGGLQTSVSGCSVLASSARIGSPWKTDLFQIMEIPATLAESKPLKSPISCNLQDIGKFHDIASCNFQDILSDDNDTSVEIFCDPKNKKNNKIGPTGQKDEALGENCSAVAFPVQKRSRKPTQRYIDEITDPILRYTKKRRGVVSSSSNIKDKCVGVKDHKKCRMGPKAAIGLPAEEASVVAIQVPFGSLVHKECPKSNDSDINKEHGTSNKQACASERGPPTIKPKDNRVNLENQKKKDECTLAVHSKKQDHSATSSSPKKLDDIFTVAHLKKKRDNRHTALSPKNRNDEWVIAASPKKRDDYRIISQKKQDDEWTDESSEEISGRRKHHRLWSIAEVKKLIDGVSEYGVGRWSRIKKLSFSASAHRTSVDLKDKWRNLLKASHMQLGSQQGEKKRNLAWRPLPKSILRRVCELSNTYPYPKGHKQQHSNSNKSVDIYHDSPDKSTDITLSDYRRILRSINGN
ncbi:hypothetical protein CASFOL_013406 [Castilleja foliolosa]|uniref:Uncharacterized protein n=1 Tax=Castilleja foliolosa TaxID=1961234 RepID=A0ABD3DJW8_9LAMI